MLRACTDGRLDSFVLHAATVRCVGRFYQPGMPAKTPSFNETLREESQGLADEWIAAADDEGADKAAGIEGERGIADPRSATFDAWPSPQKVLQVNSRAFVMRIYCRVFLCSFSPSPFVTSTPFSRFVCTAAELSYGIM